MKPSLWRAALLYAALTLLLTWPLGIAPHRTSLPVDPDRMLFMWNLAWNTHAVGHEPLSIFDSNIYYPYQRTLAYSENLLGSTIFAAPVLWLTDNPLLAMNVVALLSCVLCGVGAYLLARRLGIGEAGALLCGLIFAFSPARFFRIGQLHLTTVQWMPFSLAFLHTYFETRRPRDLRLAILFFTAQVWTSGHGAVFLAVGVIALLVYRFALGEPLELKRRARDVGLAGALLLVPVAVMAVPYQRVQAEMGLKRTLENWAATPESFLTSPTHVHQALLSLFWKGNIYDTATANLFPGYIPVLLTAAALLTVRQTKRLRDNATPFYLLLTALAVSLSAGPPISIWPLVYSLPGFNFIRGPSRFMLLGILAIAVLAAIGFERVTAHASSRTRRLIAVALGMLLVVEFAAIPFTLEHYRVRIPAADRWLAWQPKPFVVAEVPTLPSERYHTNYMLHSMAHWQKTVHGYSGMRPPLHDELYAQLRSFPDEQSIRRLIELGVTYVVVHPGMYPPEMWPSVDERLRTFHAQLALRYTGTDGRVYALRR